MENLLDYVSLLQTMLPTTVLSPLIHTLSTTYGILRTLQTHLQPFLLRVLAQPDAYSIILLLVVLFVSWQILGMAYRAVMFWVRLLMRVFFYGSMLAVGMWVYQRGLDGFVEDVQGLVELFGREVERFSGEAKMFGEEKEREIKGKQRAYGRGW